MNEVTVSIINQRLSKAFDAGNAVEFSIAAADAVVYAEILEQTNERLHDRNKSQEKRIEELEAELLSLRTGEGDDEVTRLEQDLAKLKADYAFSQEQLREAQVEVERLKGERDKNFMAFTGEAMKFGVKQEFRDQQIATLTADLDALQSQLAAMQAASVEEVEEECRFIDALEEKDTLTLSDLNLSFRNVADLARTFAQQRDEEHKAAETQCRIRYLLDDELNAVKRSLDEMKSDIRIVLSKKWCLYEDFEMMTRLNLLETYEPSKRLMSIVAESEVGT